MSDLQQYVGSCLCGAVTYQIDGPIGDIIQCHCQKCRKANGTAYATNAPIAKADFKLTSGQDVVKKYASSAGTERCFCGNCGSPLISIKAETPEFYRLRIGKKSMTRLKRSRVTVCTQHGSVSVVQRMTCQTTGSI